MCGLIAYYKTSDRPVDPRLIEDMTHIMRYRGPDDYGFCFVGPDGPVTWRNGERPPPMNAKGVAMGHRRYSIFDLTEAGRQPFLRADGRYAMVFNGEIYNFIELREELRQHGFRFSTDCDTEVLLTAFEKWGTDCFARLNGAWAVAIWDNVSKELVVARDRIGEKPLQYAQIDGDWIFGSEIKALLKHPRMVAQPNEQSILNFIANGSSPITGETFFSGIQSLEPGTFLTFCDGTFSKSRYWCLDRMTTGLVTTIPLCDSMVLPRVNGPPFSRLGILDRGAIHKFASEQIERFKIKTAGVDVRTGTLSGGNLQKALLAREIAWDPMILLVAQPTRGLDIGATEFVHRQFLDLRARGRGLMVISEDLEELFTLSDRIAVIYEGRIMAVLPVAEATAQHVGLLMAGYREEAS